MSIATEIQRLQTAKADIKSAIEEKGVTVGDGTIDTYATLISQITGGGGSDSNVGYKTSEVKITSNVTNAKALFDIIFKDADLAHNLVAYLTHPQETDYIYNQITFLSNTDGVKRGVRYRDGVYSIIEIAANYDVAVTIGDTYTVVDLDEYVEDRDYEQGFEDGKNSVVQFDRYLKTATFTSLNMFGKSEAVFNFDNIANSLSNLFYCDAEEKRNTTVEHLTINCPTLVISISQMLYCQYPYTDVTLKRLTLNVDTQNCSNYKNAFTHQRALEIIDGKPLDYSSATASNINGFSNCIALVEVRFVANSIKYSISFANCSNLSTDTIQSIIDGLADLTGGTAQTLTVHQTVRNQLTDEQLTTISNKNWAISPAEAKN